MLTRFQNNNISQLQELPNLVAMYLKKLPQTIEPIGTPLTILRYEFPCKQINILQWLFDQTTETKIYWSDRDGKIEVGGVGIADILKGNDTVNYQQTFEYIEDHLSKDNPHQQYYGGFGFDEHNTNQEWNAFGTYQFILPRFEFYKKDNECHFAVNIPVKDINVDFSKQLNHDSTQIKFNSSDKTYTIPTIKNRVDTPDYSSWSQTFQKAHKLIQTHHLNKIVMARKSDFTFTENLDPIGLLMLLKKETPNCFHFCFQTKFHSAFLGASPERLYYRGNQQFKTEALAGTKPRSENTSKDKALESELLQSEKNLKEHNFVVNNIKTNAQTFTQKLHVDIKPQLLKLHAGHHLMTKFEGILKDKTGDHTIIKAIHPTPAVAGDPVKISTDAIRQLELFSRGWYAGPIGHVGLNQTEFAVGIRSALLTKNRLSLFAGAGIVNESEAQDEWEEIENKVSTFLKIFGYENSRRT